MPERRTQTHVTVDHDEIRRWAEERNAEPSRVKGVRGGGPGIITFDLPGYQGTDRLEHIGWDVETGETKAAMPRRRRKQIERFGRPLEGERRYGAAAARFARAEKPGRKAGPAKPRARPAAKKRRR